MLTAYQLGACFFLVALASGLAGYVLGCLSPWPRKPPVGSFALGTDHRPDPP